MISTRHKSMKSILFALSIIFCNFAYGLLDHTKERIFKTIENPIIYNTGTYIIDTTASVLSIGIAKFANITRIKETPEQKKQRFNKYIYRIDQRLNQIENNLKQDEINTFNNVYEEFEITNKEQETINTIIQQYKEHQQQYLCQSHEEMADTLE